MKNASEEYNQPQSLLVLGTPGSGKSTLIAQIPGIFVLDSDRNMAGPRQWLKDNNKPLNFYYANPTVDDDGKPVPRDEQFQRAMEQLQEAGESKEIKAIAIDSLTSFTDICLTEVMRQQGRARGSFSFKSKVAKTVDEPLQIQDWGAFFGLMKHIIFQLKNTDKMLVVTGHIKTDKDNLTGILKQFIAIPGQMSEIIAGFFSEVWLLQRSTELKGQAKEEVYKVITFPSGSQTESLGLKSSIGVKSGEELDVEEVIRRFA